MIPWLESDDPFPALHTALADPNGLLAAGNDLSPRRILNAYRQGIFPWFSEGQPVLWWSPDPRMVLFTAEFRLSRSLRKRLQRGEFEIRADTAFQRVMEECAAPREGQEGTWIVSEMVEAYAYLHHYGYAHSVEAWQDGELVGGLYGIAIGRMFYGESMFARVTDASKAALAHLVAHLKLNGFPLIDCQQETGHLGSLGGRPIPRTQFASEISSLVNLPAAAALPLTRPGRWTDSFAGPVDLVGVLARPHDPTQ